VHLECAVGLEGLVATKIEWTVGVAKHDTAPPPKEKDAYDEEQEKEEEGGEDDEEG
jgi:hypothetical protein